MEANHSDIDRDYVLAVLICVVLFFIFTAARFWVSERKAKPKHWKQINEVFRDLALAFFPLAVCIFSWEFILRDARRLEAEATLSTVFQQHFAGMASIEAAGIIKVRGHSNPTELRDFSKSAVRTLRILVPWFLDPTALKSALAEMVQDRDMFIQIILLKPTSPYAVQRGRIVQPKQRNYGASECSRSLFALRDAFAEQGKARYEVLVYDSLPSAFIVQADDRALLGWYMNVGTALDVPLLECAMTHGGLPTEFGDAIEREWAKLLTMCEVVDLATVELGADGIATFRSTPKTPSK